MAKAPVRKKRSASAVAEFKTNVPFLIRDAWLAMLTRFAAILEEDRVAQIQDIVAAHMDKNGLAELPPAYDQPMLGYTRFAEAISTFIDRGTKMLSPQFNHNLRMLQSKDPESFLFRLGNDNWRLTLGPTNVPGGEHAFAAKDPFAPVIKLLKELGIDLNRNVPITEVFIADGYEQPNYHRSANFSKELLGRATHEKSLDLAKTGVIQAKLVMNTVITDTNMEVTPFVELEIDRTIYDNIVDYEGERQEPLYIYMWLMQAVSAATNQTTARKWKGAPVVDLRSVSKKLRNVKSTFGAVKARVNKEGFAIGGEGLPLFLPEVDNCVEYINTISKSTKIEDGVYDFAESHLQWANKIVMIDWFNDYILYADTRGELRDKRLLGVRALDAQSEMMFLETPINQTETLIGTLQTVQRLASENVDESEARSFMDKETIDFFADSKIPNIFSAMGQLQAGNVDRTRERSSFSDKAVIGLKHVLGMDLDELRDEQRLPLMQAYAGVVRGYLRALYKKRGKLDIPVYTRLNGFEYILHAADKYHDKAKWVKARDEYSRMVSEMNSTFAYPAEIDLPNLTIGPKNIQALMPHQVRYLGATRDGVTAGAAGIATGGGKGLVSPLDVIQQMSLGRVKRPLIATKPRLVKENITEINRISGGKINVVPLRTRNIRHLKRKAGLKTAKDWLDWARNLPPNTIFICAYSDFGTRSTLFEDLDVPGRALWYDVQLSQMVHLIRLIGVDMVYGDESHLIKNMKSRRSICSYSVFAGADQTRVASGTFNPNTPKDLVGQYFALNPVIFGNNTDEFEAQYNIRGGLLKSDDDAKRLNARRRELSRTFEADEEDWAFVLPVFRDEIEYFSLTPLQEEFYNILLQRARLEMMAKEEEFKKKGKVKLKLGEEDDTAEEEDDDEDDEDDFEDEESRYIAIATASLAGVEQFIIAPDANEEYVRWVKRPTGDDLISPAVKRLDERLDAHFKAVPKERWKEEKILVFGWNKVASVHLFKHSRWAKSGLHYTAGDEEAVRKFKTEDDRLVLFADEGSLREGENLQMCSRVCRMQPVWTPGDYKQAAARAYRPDPRGTFANREDVRHVWFIAQGQRGRPTVSSLKLATMVSKSISNARLRYEDDMSWRRISPEFEHLKRMRMNFQVIFETQKEDVEPYLSKWGMFNKWVGSRVEQAKIREAERLEREYNIDLIKGGKILDMQQFLKLAMRPVTSKKDLPGSRRVYTPWEFGATPADVYGLDLAVLGGQQVTVGTPVMTEFGAALVVGNDSDRSVKLELYGGKTITLRRLAVAIPSTTTGKQKLKNIVSSKQQWKATYTSPRIRASANPQDIGDEAPRKPGAGKTPPIPAPKQPARDTRPTDDDDEHVEIFTQIINGWPFLGVAANDAPPAMRKLKGWTEMPAFTAYSFLSWKTADQFLDILADKFFFPQSKFNKMVEELETLREGRAMRLTRRVKDSEVRSFFLAQHKLKGKAKNGRYIIDPYWVAFEDVIYIAFDRRTHAPAVLTWLKNAKVKIKGMRAAAPNDGFYLYQFKTMKEAQDGIKAAAQYLNYDAEALRDEINELKEDLQQFATKKSVPRR